MFLFLVSAAKRADNESLKNSMTQIRKWLCQHSTDVKEKPPPFSVYIKYHRERHQRLNNYAETNEQGKQGDRMTMCYCVFTCKSKNKWIYVLNCGWAVIVVWWVLWHSTNWQTPLVDAGKFKLSYQSSQPLVGHPSLFPVAVWGPLISFQLLKVPVQGAVWSGTGRAPGQTLGRPEHQLQH